MKKVLDIFYEMPCLTEKSYPLKGGDLQKKWFKQADKRIIGQYLQKFISYNSTLFKFLKIEPLIIGSDYNTSIVFKSSEYIGAIPLRSPDTGKQIGDFIISPRYIEKNRFEDYIDILNILKSEINPESIDSLPLASGKNFSPPLYLEAIKFLNTLEILVKNHWRKFDVIETITNNPSGQVNWNKYSIESSKVEKRIKFPTRQNILSQNHKEYAEIKYVFELSKNELLSTNTPLKIKLGVRSKILFLEKKLELLTPIHTNNISIKSSDSTFVKHCKIQGNRILQHNLSTSTAWRIDFSDVFEKFVQYIFKETAKETGGSLFSNYKFHSKSYNRYSWELNHIEPDAIYKKEDITIFIDAKYKANLYNKWNNSEYIKEEFRDDLHQILSYTSFNTSMHKTGFLCYPSNHVELKEIELTNPINGTSNSILILGIPLVKDKIEETKKIIINKLS